MSVSTLKDQPIVKTLPCFHQQALLICITYKLASKKNWVTPGCCWIHILNFLWIEFIILATIQQLLLLIRSKCRNILSLMPKVCDYGLTWQAKRAIQNYSYHKYFWLKTTACGYYLDAQNQKLFSASF